MLGLIQILLNHDKTKDLFIAREQSCYSCPCHGEWHEIEPQVRSDFETALHMATTMPSDYRTPAVYHYSAETGEVSEIKFNYEYSNHHLHSVTTNNGWRWCDDGSGGRIWRNEHA